MDIVLNVHCKERWGDKENYPDDMLGLPYFASTVATFALFVITCWIPLYSFIFYRLLLKSDAKWQNGADINVTGSYINGYVSTTENLEAFA